MENILTIFTSTCVTAQTIEVPLAVNNRSLGWHYT